MATIVDEAICIRHWDWSETSQTVSLLTRGHGIVRGLAKGARREKGAFSGGIEIATRGEVVAILKPTGALATLTAWELRGLHPGLRRALGAFHAGMYAVDLVHHSVSDGDPHPGLFDALRAALEAFGPDERSTAEALLRFQWATLAETGYAPDLEAREVGEVLVFSPERGRLVPGGDGWRVRAGTVSALRQVAEGQDLGGVEGASLGRANRLLAALLRHVLGREVPAMRALWRGDPLEVGGNSP